MPSAPLHEAVELSFAQATSKRDVWGDDVIYLVPASERMSLDSQER